MSWNGNVTSNLSSVDSLLLKINKIMYTREEKKTSNNCIRLLLSLTATLYSFRKND